MAECTLVQRTSRKSVRALTVPSSTLPTSVTHWTFCNWSTECIATHVLPTPNVDAPSASSSTLRSVMPILCAVYRRRAPKLPIQGGQGWRQEVVCDNQRQRPPSLSPLLWRRCVVTGKPSGPTARIGDLLPLPKRGTPESYVSSFGRAVQQWLLKQRIRSRCVDEACQALHEFGGCRNSRDGPRDVLHTAQECSLNRLYGFHASVEQP